MFDCLDVDKKVKVESNKNEENKCGEFFGHRFGAPDLRERVVGNDKYETIEGGGGEHPRWELSKEEKREDVELAGERAAHVNAEFVDHEVAEWAEPDDDQIG